MSITVSNAKAKLGYSSDEAQSREYYRLSPRKGATRLSISSRVPDAFLWKRPTHHDDQSLSRGHGAGANYRRNRLAADAAVLRRRCGAGDDFLSQPRKDVGRSRHQASHGLCRRAPIWVLGLDEAETLESDGEAKNWHGSKVRQVRTIEWLSAERCTIRDREARRHYTVSGVPASGFWKRSKSCRSPR